MAVLTRQGLMLVAKNNGSAHPSGFDVGGQNNGSAHPAESGGQK